MPKLSWQRVKGLTAEVLGKIGSEVDALVADTFMPESMLVPAEPAKESKPMGPSVLLLVVVEGAKLPPIPLPADVDVSVTAQFPSGITTAQGNIGVGSLKQPFGPFTLTGSHPAIEQGIAKLGFLGTIIASANATVTVEVTNEVTTPNQPLSNPVPVV